MLALTIKYFIVCEIWVTQQMCENCFPMCFFEGGYLKVERCEYRDDISIVDGDQEGTMC